MLAVIKLMNDFFLQQVFIMSPVLAESGVCQLAQSKIVLFCADFYAYLFVMLIWFNILALFARVSTGYPCTVVSSIGCNCNA